MGEVAVMDAASGRVTTVADVNPELKDFAVGDLKPVHCGRSTVRRSGDCC